MKKSYIKILIIILSVFLLNFSFDKKREVSLSYQKMLKRSFDEKSEGRIIPITIEQTTELDGEITGDGLYFFYSSNKERGNYDIYLRSMTGITTARITSHASKDFSPAISPDGRKLAFVSFREDPEGDIYIINLDPEKVLKNVQTSLVEQPSLDRRAINITAQVDKNSGMVKVVKDASPVWSPDGESLAYSTFTNGEENIWLSDKNGENKRQITKDGGLYPRFSSDGTKIIYISYKRKKSKGDVYIIDLKTNKIEQVTNTNTIELSPTFLGTNYECVYTKINSDTNNDKKINLKDHSILYYKNIRTNVEYPLTYSSVSSFSAKWSPAYSLKYFNSNIYNFKGVLIYSEQNKNNININMIPEFGVIAKRKSAVSQYKLADQLSSIKDEDPEKYYLSLKRIYSFFYNKNDFKSVIYVAKALKDAVVFDQQNKNRKRALEIIKLLSSISTNKNDYRNVTASFLKNKLNKKASVGIYLNTLEIYTNEKKYSKYIPYLLEDIADYYADQKKTVRAVKTYKKIINNFPKYERKNNVNFKLGRLTYKKLSNEISTFYYQVLLRGTSRFKEKTINKLLQKFLSLKDLKKQKTILKNIHVAYSKSYLTSKGREKQAINRLLAVLEYAVGQTHYKLKNNQLSKNYFEKSLKRLKKTELIFYKVNLALAQIAEREKKFELHEKYLSNCALNYQPKWKQKGFVSIVKKLINYYEEQGKIFEQNNQYQKAVPLYRKYTKLMARLHFRRKYEDLYSVYGARAHVLYVDAYIKKNKNNLKAIEKLEQKYLGKNNSELNIKRLEFAKAHMYGMAYLYNQAALISNKAGNNFQLAEGILSNKEQLAAEYFRKAINQIDWALFMDDRFIDSYLLKGWIYQYVDLKRNKNDELNSIYSKYFPAYLLEKNKSIYERALIANDEKINPEQEGNLHLNRANTYFLLENYPKAFTHYLETSKLKKYFASKKEEAFFHYHFGYCYWQKGNISFARREMKKAFQIYEILAGSRNLKKYAKQYYMLYSYFALFDRLQGKFKSAITWYDKIIKITTRYRIKIDKARIYQEIAFCYEQEKQFEKSLTYLSFSENILNQKQHSEQEYNLRIKMFGLGKGVGLYNLGADSVVIGDGRIFTPLDVLQKKLLNYSMQESISYKQDDYNKTILFLNKKLELLSGRENSIDKEMRILALNNIGHAYYKLENFKKAEKFFNKAWQYAASKEVNDLQGTFVSIINIANLYAYILENNIEYFELPLQSLEALIQKIVSYRNNYEKVSFESSLAIKKSDAKKLNKELTNNEIDELKKQVKLDAAEKYYKIDLNIAILNYYLAEILYKENNLDTSVEIYKVNKNIYNLYVSSAKKFEEIIERNQTRQKFKVKLILNAAKCWQRTGFLQRAYELLGEAETIVEKNKFHKLQLKLFYAEARFFERNGKAFDKNYKNLTIKYYKKALSLIKKVPQLFVTNINEVDRVYSKYALFLANNSKGKESFAVLEEKNKIMRILRVYMLSPKFTLDTENSLFNEVKNIINELSSLYSKRSTLIENGKSLKDDILLKVVAEIKKNHKKLIKIKEKNKNKQFNSYLFYYAGSSKRNYNVEIFVFEEDAKHLFAWKLYKTKISFKKIKKENDDYENLANNLLRKNKNTEKFIVYNKAFLNLIQERNKAIDNVDFMYTSSVFDVKQYLKKKPSLYLKKTIINNDKYENIYSSVIIDNKINSKLLLNAIYKGEIIPSLIVKRIEGFDYNDIFSLLDAAIYANVNSILFVNDKNEVTVVDNNITIPIVNTFAKLNKKNTNDKHFLFFGKNDSFDLNDDKIKETLSLIKKYHLEIKNSNLNKALYYLNAWKEAIGDNAQKNAEYNYYLAQIMQLNGSLEKALNVLNVINLTTVQNETFLNKIKTLKIFLLLKKGEAKKASELLKLYRNNLKLSESNDFQIYKQILSLIKSQNIKKIQYNNKFILPQAKLKSLLARYLIIYNKENLVQSIFHNFKVENTVETIDKLFINIVTNSRLYQFKKIRINNIANMFKFKKQKLMDSVFQNLKDNNRYDYLSKYALFAGINSMIKNNFAFDANELLQNIKLKKVTSKGYKIDNIILLNIIKNFYISNDKYLKAEEVIDLLLSNCKNQFLFLVPTFLNEKIKIALLQEDYQKATLLISEVQVVIKKTDPLYSKFILQQIEKEIYVRDIASALLLINSYKFNKKEDQLILNLLLAQIERFKIFQNPKKSREFILNYEKYMTNVLNHLEKRNRQFDRYFRYDLFNSGIDFLIILNVRKKNFYKALYYYEIKKQINAWKYISNNLFKNQVPEKISKEFVVLKNIYKERNRFYDILNKYPKIYLENKIPFLPLQSYQQNLTDNTITLVFSKNQSDLIVWFVTNEFVDAIRITSGYKRLTEIMRNYSNNVALLKNTGQTSKELTKLFRRVINRSKKMKNIVIMHDRFFDNIPFELIGDKNILAEKHNIIYNTSLVVNTNTKEEKFDPKVFLLKSKLNNIKNKLERIAIAESGIKYEKFNSKKDVKNTIIHIQKSLQYDSVNKNIVIGADTYKRLVNKNKLIFVSTNEAERLGINNLVLLSNLLKNKAIIINNTTEQSVNNAFFIENLYGKLKAGQSILNAFNKSIKKLLMHKKYNHAAYWTGKRLYINGFIKAYND